VGVEFTTWRQTISKSKSRDVGLDLTLVAGLNVNLYHISDPCLTRENRIYLGKVTPALNLPVAMTCQRGGGVRRGAYSGVLTKWTAWKVPSGMTRALLRGSERY
jgi:hypothetical protein